MKEIILKSGYLRRKHFKIDDDTEKYLSKIANDYNLTEEQVISLAIGNDKAEVKGNKNKIKELRKEIDALLQEMFSVEGEWSAIRYKSHTLTKDLKTLAVVLIGQLSQNRTLRRQLNKKPKYEELRKKAEYYLFNV